MSSTLSFDAVAALHASRIGDGFRAHSARGAVRDRLDPFMGLDLFHMSQPTFAPHPHAGFSAVTYMLPESEGALWQRDSLGGDDLIPPGSLHWTQAGRGVIHEERPAVPGMECWGFQLFVSLPRELELCEPGVFHLEPDQIPSVERDGVLVRVVAGALGSTRSPLEGPHTGLRLLDVELQADGRFEAVFDQDERGWVIVMHGEARVGDTELGPGELLVFEGGGRLVVQGLDAAARVFVASGRPVRTPKLWGGSLALSSAERLEEARVRFTRGEMGRLDPLDANARKS